MSLPADELLNVRRFDSLPATVAEAKEFLREKGFDTSLIDENVMATSINKLSQKKSLSPEEVKAFHHIIDIGDTCGCDNDHRMRSKYYFNDTRKVGYART